MTLPIFLIWLVSILSQTTIGTLTNEKFELAGHIYSVALMNGINPQQFLKLAECESRLIETAKGDFSSENKSYLAYVAFQFHKQTFNSYKEKYGLKHLEYKNSYDQTWLAAKIITDPEDKAWGHWLNCRRITLDRKSTH